MTLSAHDTHDTTRHTTHTTHTTHPVLHWPRSGSWSSVRTLTISLAKATGSHSRYARYDSNKGGIKLRNVSETAGICQISQISRQHPFGKTDPTKQNPRRLLRSSRASRLLLRSGTWSKRPWHAKESRNRRTGFILKSFQFHSVFESLFQLSFFLKLSRLESVSESLFQLSIFLNFSRLESVFESLFQLSYTLKLSRLKLFFVSLFQLNFRRCTFLCR